MRDADRLSVDDFLAWQRLVDGRYELVDGAIVPHPDYVTPQGFAAPDADHAAVCADLVTMLTAQLAPPCRVYVGAAVVVDRVNANVPDLAISCDPGDRERSALAHPTIVVEVGSPRTARVDTGRKVADYVAIASLRAYVVVDRRARAVTVYRPDAGPQTTASGSVALGDGLALDVDRLFG